MATPEDVLDLPDVAAWEAWLEAHHDTAPEVWLRIAKRGSGLATIAIGDALDGALCFGWIDGQRKGLDDVSFLQRYCPRRARSSWSQVNVEKVDALTAAGRMRPSGVAEVEKAKADGRWDAAYERQSTAEVPDDLAVALAADPRRRGGLRRTRQERAVRRVPAGPEGHHARGTGEGGRAGCRRTALTG